MSVLWVGWRCTECGKRLETRNADWVPQCGARPAYGQPRHRVCPMTRVEVTTTPTMAADTSNPARCTDVATNTETAVQPLKGQLDIYGNEA